MSDWTIKDRRLESLAKGSSTEELNMLLEAVLGAADHQVANLLRLAYPVVIARIFGPPSWAQFSRKEECEQYKFQLGPHSWGELAALSALASGDHNRPPYQTVALEIARKLKENQWERLAASILPGDNVDPDTVQIALCWQEDGAFLAIHDRDRRLALAFKREKGSISFVGEAHPACFENLGNRYREWVSERPIIPLDEGIFAKQPGSHFGKRDELIEKIRWRYATRLDDCLDHLLLEASDRLASVEGELGLAYAAHRFNDAAGDDHWLAVRKDNFAWENGQYFTSNAASLQSAPETIHFLIGIAVHLRASGLGEALRDAYGYPLEPLDVLGLFRQEGRLLFACSNSQGSCGPVYEIDPASGKTQLCGFTDRFDWNFNRGIRAGGIMPRDPVLEVVAIEEVTRRIMEGDTPVDGGPPHDLMVPWELYAPEPKDG